MVSTTKLTISHECPYCGIPILWRAGTSIPSGVEYVKTKRHSVVLVHKNCIERRLQNEH